MTFKRIILFLLLALLGMYILSLLSVSPIIRYVEDIFEGKVPKAETNNTHLTLYNSYHDELQPNYEVEAKVRPIFAFKFWKKGTILVYYEYWVYDENGKRLWGFAARFPEPPSKWTIEKVDGEWKIVDIYESP